VRGFFQGLPSNSSTIIRPLNLFKIPNTSMGPGLSPGAPITGYYKQMNVLQTILKFWAYGVKFLDILRLLKVLRMKYRFVIVKYKNRPIVIVTDSAW